LDSKKKPPPPKEKKVLPCPKNKKIPRKRGGNARNYEGREKDGKTLFRGRLLPNFPKVSRLVLHGRKRKKPGKGERPRTGPTIKMKGGRKGTK